MNLRQILQDKIEYYLKNDNKEHTSDNSVVGAACKFFYIEKIPQDEGRKRALKYQTYLTSIPDNQLFKTVLKEASNAFDYKLGSSKTLRLRLLAGLCKYLEISDQEIRRTQQVVRDNINAILRSSIGQPVYVNHDVMLIRELGKLITDKINSRSRLMEQDDRDIELKVTRRRSLST